MTRWILGAGLLAVGLTVAAAESFQDCPTCPRMVTIPAGTFTMGSPPDEPERLKFEGPRSGVHVESFAIGETEVTRAQYARFVKATKRPPPEKGCFQFGFVDIVYTNGVDEQWMNRRASWRNPGFAQTDDHPVTCVSWQDATDYAAWLTKETGKPYRLPSDAEWEYADRAGGTTPYPWGTDVEAACAYANVGDKSLLKENAIIRRQTEEGVRTGQLNLRFVGCDDGYAYTAPVARHRPNGFGLHDMTGNVWEYIADCWQEALPESGAAHEEPGCTQRRVRGGSWDDSPPELRSARRSRVAPDLRRNDGGFRVARSLTTADH